MSRSEGTPQIPLSQRLEEVRSLGVAVQDPVHAGLSLTALPRL